MWSPEDEGRSLIENTSFCGFSAGLRRPNRLAAVGGIMAFGGFSAGLRRPNRSAAVGGILVSSGFAAIFAEF